MGGLSCYLSPSYSMFPLRLTVMDMLAVLLAFWHLRLVQAASLDPFVLGSFVPSATFSVAHQLGFFEAQGLNVTFAPVA